MNNRVRQKMKAIMLLRNPDIPATIKGDDGWLHMVFIPQGQEDKYREFYGDKLNIWKWCGEDKNE